MSATTIWFASFPKSGNTWLRAMVSGVLEGGEVRLRDVVRRFTDMTQGAVFTEFGLTPSVLDDRQAQQLVTAAAEAQARRSTGMLFRKSHSAYGPPGDARRTEHNLATGAKALYVVRDPRAVAPSLAHHLGVDLERAVQTLKEGALIDTPEEIDDRYLIGGPRVASDWGSWSVNVLTWLDQSEIPVHVIRYEDLIDDPHAKLTGALDWLGIEATDELIAQAVEQSSFDRLALQEALTGFAEAVSPSTAFFRKGRADSWKDELPDALAQQIVADHAPVMERLGYL